ncbi:TPA: immunoglobulin-like domain-containing protein, partial [Enterococcus faecium]
MNYKKGIAFLMISTTVLGATGMHTLSSFAEETTVATTNLVEKSAVQLTLNPYTLGKSSTITGSYNGTNGAFIRAEVNGEKKALVSPKDLAQGKINYYIGKDLKAGDNVEVVIFDKNYQEIGRQKVTLEEHVAAQLTLDSYEVGKSSTITGSYNGTNGAFIRAEVNGEKKALVSPKDL